ncbi:GRB10-interacting GYF protein 1-like isoform X2 [Phalacrocorax carbo]|uniref:GRB10-interacting GYF protein 1-like isoform X2 n=1 Tax=Phalacrocorax carbo TaxID=9209 RepID=UPI003119B0E6
MPGSPPRCRGPHCPLPLSPGRGSPTCCGRCRCQRRRHSGTPCSPPAAIRGCGAAPGLPPPSPILEQLQLQQKELRARREEDDQRKRRQEEELLRRKQCRQQEALLKLLQQSGVPGGAPQNWALPKVPPPTPDSERPPPKAQRGAPRAVGVPWGAELWPPPEKSPPAWEESGAGGAGLRGGGGGKGGRGGPPPGPGGRGPEEALLKLLRGLPRPPEPLPHWCQAALQALGAPPVPGVETPPQPPPPFEAWPRPGDPPEAQPFPRPLLEHRGPQEAWLGAGPLPLPPFGPGAKPPPPEGPGGGRGKQRPLLLLHSDPSILGYSLHGPGGEVETVEEY